MLTNLKVSSMRKILLLFTCLPLIGFSQTIDLGEGSTSTALPVQEDVARTLKDGNNQGGTFRPPFTATAKREYLFNEVQVGETQYDLQCNSSLGNRVLLHSDGSVSAVFTQANDGSPWLTRGTGYVHNDGSEWTADFPFQRLEDKRAGWCNIAVVNHNGTMKEVVVSHHAAATGGLSGGLIVMMNDGIGSTNFSIIEEYKVADNGPLWPRVVGSGNYLHIFTGYSTGKAFEIDGIIRPNTYYRYDVNNGNWLDTALHLPLYDSSRVWGGASDAYQMDVDGDNIAIVSGGLGQDLFLFKSTDNGDSWEGTIVDTFPVPRFSGNTIIEDPVDANNGSVEVLLDKDGKAHVFWSYTTISDNEVGDTSMQLSLGVALIRYWNEDMDTAVFIAQTPHSDDDTSAYAIPRSNIETDQGARYVNNSLASWPDAAIDADGNIYLTYNSPNEVAPSPNGPVYRDQYICFSSDGGATWSASQILIEDRLAEDVFLHLARDVDDHLHVVWQRDDFPGTSVLNGHSSTLSKIMYAAVPKELVLNRQLFINRSSINDQLSGDVKVGTPYPNPANEETIFAIELENAADVSISISNVLGQEMATTRFGKINGENQLRVNTADLAEGVYIYTINIDGQLESGQLQIKR